MQHHPKFEDTSYRPPGLPVQDIDQASRGFNTIYPHRRSGAVGLLAAVAIGSSFGAGVSVATGAPVNPEGVRVVYVDGDNPYVAPHHPQTVRRPRKHRTHLEKKKFKYGPTETLPLAGEQDIKSITDALTRVENDPGLESLFYQQQELFSSLWQESGGLVNQSPVSRYSAFLDDSSSPALKTLLQQSFDQEDTYWNRQNELSREDGYDYINPANTIDQILGAQNFDEAVGYLDSAMRMTFGFNVKISDNIASDLPQAKANLTTSSPLDRSPTGLNQLKVGLALIARSMGSVPTQLRPDIQTVYLTSGFELDQKGYAHVMRLPNGELSGLRNFAGMDYQNFPDQLTGKVGNSLILDIPDIINWGVDSEKAINHEVGHAIDNSTFDMTERYKKDRWTSVINPSVRVIDPVSVGSKRAKVIHRDWLSDSPVWTRYATSDGIINPDGSIGPRFFSVYTSLYGSSNNHEDFAENTSSTLINPQYFIGDMHYQMSEKGVVTLEPKDLKRIGFIFSVAARSHRSYSSFAKNLRDRSVVITGKGGMK